MSAIITDFLTSLANKIRSKLGTSDTYTPAEAVAAIDDVYTKGVTDTKVGDAAASHVLSGKTFTNSTTVGETGTMTNRGAVSQTLDTSTTSYTVPAGYHNGSGTVSITTQEGSASPSTSAVTYTPDTGKVYSSFTVSAMSPQRTAGTSASISGRDSTGPYVYFPYGWWPNAGSSRNYTRLTEAQAIAVARTQEKSAASSTSDFDVVPDTNYLLSKVTVTGLTMSGTYTPSGSNRNKSAVDMGPANTYRYVKTSVCYSYGYETAGASLTEKAFKETSAYQTYWDQTVSGLTSGRVYAVFALVIQNGGTFSGVSSGATISLISGGSGLNSSWSQIEAANVSTANHGGMVMWSHGTFIASSTSAIIRLNTVSKLSAYWKVYVVGV